MNGWHRDTGDYVATVEAPLSAGANAPEVTDDLEASDSVRDLLRRHAEGLYRFYDLGKDYICIPASSPRKYVSSSAEVPGKNGIPLICTCASD